MTAEEKAKLLVETFEFQVRDLDGEVSHSKDEAIQCALLCVEEIIQELEEVKYNVLNK